MWQIKTRIAVVIQAELGLAAQQGRRWAVSSCMVCARGMFAKQGLVLHADSNTLYVLTNPTVLAANSSKTHVHH
jgi:hypothetical protein